MKGRRELDDDSDDRPAKRKRRRSRKPMSAKWIVLPLLFILLAGGIGLGVYFFLTRGDKLQQLSERFQGKWQGSSYEHPGLVIRMDVAKEKFTYDIKNAQGNDGVTLKHTWKPLKVSRNTLYIRQEMVGVDKTNDWTVEFKSDDEISMTSLTSGRTVGDFKRVK